MIGAHNGPSVQCEFCGRSFGSVAGLRSHCVQKHIAEMEAARADDAPATPAGSSVQSSRRREARKRVQLAKDAEELHLMAARLLRIIERHRWRCGASVTGLENARRELDYMSKVMRS